MREGLRTYRDLHVIPQVREQHNWERLLWATLARDKQVKGDEPKAPSILSNHE